MTIRVNIPVDADGQPLPFPEAEMDTAMSASKRRLRWDQVPPPVKWAIEQLADGQVVAAVNCAGGFSPGLASRLTLAAGHRFFVKAIDSCAWPDQAAMYRAEASLSAALPRTVPAPRLLRWLDDGRWVVLVFECVDGSEPDLRRSPEDARRVAAALADLARMLTPSPIAAPSDHPRLGGWAELARDRDSLARLPGRSRWAADHLSLLITLEAEGLRKAKGESLVHFDAYPHNILLTADRVLFADWPHARLGAPFIDLILFASSAAAAGVDPEPIVTGYSPAAATGPPVIDAVLAAHAGFCLRGSLYTATPDFAPIIAAKAELGTAAITWLQRRLARGHRRARNAGGIPPAQTD
jgi:Ser/Thr protein kinase RdoA (MazF antagonist)